MALPGDIFDAVKNYLDMTWTLTPEETAKITGIIERGMSYINRVAGAEQDFTQENQARALLMDYVRYVRSNAFDEFQTNYLPELLSLQMYQEVANDTESPENTEP